MRYRPNSISARFIVIHSHSSFIWIIYQISNIMILFIIMSISVTNSSTLGIMEHQMITYLGLALLDLTSFCSLSPPTSKYIFHLLRLDLLQAWFYKMLLLYWKSISRSISLSELGLEFPQKYTAYFITIRLPPCSSHEYTLSARNYGDMNFIKEKQLIQRVAFWNSITAFDRFE